MWSQSKSQSSRFGWGCKGGPCSQMYFARVCFWKPPTSSLLLGYVQLAKACSYSRSKCSRSSEGEGCLPWRRQRLSIFAASLTSSLLLQEKAATNVDICPDFPVQPKPLNPLRTLQIPPPQGQAAPVSSTARITSLVPLNSISPGSAVISAVIYSPLEQ